MSRSRVLIGVSLAFLLAGCALSESGEELVTSTSATTSATHTEPPAEPCVEEGFGSDCPVPGYPDRPFDIDVPEPQPSTSMPLLVVLHGGGGNSETARRRACTDGDLGSDSCFKEVGEREGFITVYPNGTGGRLAGEIRTWNAGGGGSDHACVSGRACEFDIDDVAYVRAVLEEVEAQYEIDASRIYATGFSNGAAMAHRLGCEMSDRLGAVVPVSGGNQFATTADCSPSDQIAVIHIHGTADPCWTYGQTSEACLEQDERPKVGVAESTSTWVDDLGCDPDPIESLMPDTVEDGMETTVEIWGDCASGSEVRLMTIEGGGHAYPGGAPGREGIVGSPTQDWGFPIIWEQLSRFSN